MKQRCSNPKAISYKYYGQKGVKVCDEWANDFQAFHDWAMSHGYSDNLTIDRRDSDGDYCPENCSWATNKQQQNHTSYNRVYTYNGETKNVIQWSETVGLSPALLYQRLHRGWDIARALTTKKSRKNEVTNYGR
jgi:hypothetical protein